MPTPIGCYVVLALIKFIQPRLAFRRKGVESRLPIVFVQNLVEKFVILVIWFLFKLDVLERFQQRHLLQIVVVVLCALVVVLRSLGRVVLGYRIITSRFHTFLVLIIELLRCHRFSFGH